MELPDKSIPAGPPKKNLQPVIQGASQAQRPATRRFFDFMFAESPKALGAKIGRDVVVPRIKAGLEEALNSFLAGMLWGGGPRPMSNMVSGTVLRAGGMSYNQLSHTPVGTPLQAAPQQTSSTGNYQDITCPTQHAAEILLANMYDLFNQYRVVAVADLYEIAGIKPAPSDNAYGWTNLDGARIVKSREGYVLELPRPTLI